MSDGEGAAAMSLAKEILFLGGARTPFAEYEGGKNGRGEPGGRLKHVTANELGAHAARAALDRSGVAPSHVDHVVFGNALQTSADAIYGARHVGLRAGVPIEVPAITVNRICGSGIQAAVSASLLMLAGDAEVVLAGGMESMSQAPHVIRGARSGFKLGQGALEDLLMASLMDPYCGCTMAHTSDNVAREQGIGREAQDAYALLSQQRAARARERGVFRDEIAPIEIRERKGALLIDEDDHLKPDTTMEGLAKLPPAFGKESFVTAGNASGIVDGGAALVMATREGASRAGGRPIGRVVAWGIAGVEPRVMGIGPVPAIRKALERAGLSLAQVDLFEINEAFAGQYLGVEKALGLDRERVNVNGGAIAIGHPLGATGARLLLTLLLELRRRAARIGVASACIGGGQGIALVVESIR
jgi:acetyl-CoA acetyltransferase family protein